MHNQRIFSWLWLMVILVVVLPLSPMIAGQAVLCAPAFFPKESKAGRMPGGKFAPAGTVVDVLQENPRSVFVEWERNRAWVDRQRLLDGNSQLAPAEKATLGVDVTFEKPDSLGGSRRIDARRGSKVDVWMRSGDSLFVQYQGACGWIPESATGTGDPFAKRITASLSEFPKTGELHAAPEMVPSKIYPELVYEKLVPFELLARITSLRHYDETPPKNGYHTGSTSFADFSLVWGPLLEDYTVRSTQGYRKNSFRIQKSLPGGMDANDYCHNFHIVSDTEAIKSKVLAAKDNDFVTLTGALVQVSGDPARFTNPVRWTSSIAGEYCYVFLVEEFTNHGAELPKKELPF